MKLVSPEKLRKLMLVDGGRTMESVCREYTDAYVPDSDPDKKARLNIWDHAGMVLPLSYIKRLEKQLEKFYADRIHR